MGLLGKWVSWSVGLLVSQVGWPLGLLVSGSVGQWVCWTAWSIGHWVCWPLGLLASQVCWSLGLLASQVCWPWGLLASGSVGQWICWPLGLLVCGSAGHWVYWSVGLCLSWMLVHLPEIVDPFQTKDDRLRNGRWQTGRWQTEDNRPRMTNWGQLRTNGGQTWGWRTDRRTETKQQFWFEHIFVRYMKFFSFQFSKCGGRSAVEMASGMNNSHTNRSSPPCRVCGGEASGFHYGVDSCEGCKVRMSTILRAFGDTWIYTCFV